MATDGSANEEKQADLRIILAIILAPYIVTTVLLAARFFVRIRLRTVGREDHLMLGAWVYYTVSLGAALAFEKAMYTPKTVQDIFTSSNWWADMEIVAYVFSTLTILLAKFSVGFLLLRLIGRTSRGKVWFFHVTLAVYTLVTLFCIALGVVSATIGGFPRIPYASEEEESDILYQEEFLLPFYCDHEATPEIIVLATWCILGAFLDFAYSIIGIHTVSSTRMNGYRRIGLCLLFGLGFVAGGMAIGRAVVSLCQVRYAWSTLLYDNRYWAFLEGPIVMACGNLCTLVPLWEYFRHNKLLRASKPTPPPVPQQQLERRRAATVPQRSYLGWFSALWPTIMVVEESENAELTVATSCGSNSSNV